MLEFLRHNGYIDGKKEIKVNRLRQIAKILRDLWMGLGRILGIINSTILLSVVYAVLIGIMSLIVKALRKDLLNHRAVSDGPFWKEKEPVDHTLEQARHQF